MIPKTFTQKAIATGMMVAITALSLTGCGSEPTLTDFASYAKEIDEISLPEEFSVVALGEATHGNSEFQELKLDVFSHLVETTAVRAFALEADYGGCSFANDYIVYDEGTSRDAVKKLGFEIYQTDEMLELVEWMHDHNLNASEDEKVRLYGIDMQQYLGNLQRLETFYQTTDRNKGVEYLSAWDTYYIQEEGKLSSDNLSNLKTLVKDVISDLEQNADTYRGVTSEATYAYALQAATCLLQHLDLYDVSSDYISYAETRDKYIRQHRPRFGMSSV